jgi:hypothetical protein
MFAWPAVASFLFSGNVDRKGSRISLAALFLVFSILIGLRTNTGGDWINYEDFSELLSLQPFSGIFSQGSEAGFVIITWLSNQIGWGVYGASAFCGIVLTYAVIRFARHQPDSWLAITAAVPYLLIVVGMGYIRQAAAIGFIILALLNFDEHKRFWCGAFIVLAALFHTSAIVIIPFFAVIIARRNILYLVPVIIGSIPVFYFSLREKYNAMVEYYINQEYDSSGALIRLLMNAIPSVVFLLFRKRFQLSEDMKLIWTMFAVASCLLIGAFVVSPSSTVVDRLGLYLIPIQLMVFGNLSTVLGRRLDEARLINLLGILYYAAVQFIWLNFATNAYAWLPYHFLLFS